MDCCAKGLILAVKPGLEMCHGVAFDPISNGMDVLGDVKFLS